MNATDRQIDFMLRLADERDLSDVLGTRLAGVVEAHRSGADVISKAKASEIIEFLLNLPPRPGVEVVRHQASDLNLSGLSEGHYAVGDVLFRVQTPEAGRWAGWVFVKNGSEYVDEKFGSQKPGQTYRGLHADLVAVILEDPLEALSHYGKITGRCGVCGRTLEDEVSVARGIGPVCWGRLSA